MLRYTYHPVFESDILTHGAGIDSIIQRFREKYKLSDIRLNLWNLCEAAVTHLELFDDGDRRQDVISFIRELESILEIVYLNKKLEK